MAVSRAKRERQRANRAIRRAQELSMTIPVNDVPSTVEDLPLTFADYQRMVRDNGNHTHKTRFTRISERDAHNARFKVAKNGYIRRLSDGTTIVERPMLTVWDGQRCDIIWGFNEQRGWYYLWRLVPRNASEIAPTKPYIPPKPKPRSIGRAAKVTRQTDDLALRAELLASTDDRIKRTH